MPHENIFSGRNILIATKHGKERVLGPVLKKELNLNFRLSDGLDTDLFGTFTGEIPRQHSPLSAARLKCLEAIKIFGEDIAIASEGSFGPHPSLFFVAADTELLLVVDKLNDLEIAVQEVTTNTNFKAEWIAHSDELTTFCNEVKFPSHAIILRDAPNSSNIIFKGIMEQSELIKAFDEVLRYSDKVWVETDMRACFNPTRMEVIKSLAEKLIQKMKSYCPSCNTPGFDVIKVDSGLPCGLCGFPTSSTLSHTFGCLKCDFTSKKMYPHHKESEDPRYCDICNP